MSGNIPGGNFPGGYLPKRSLMGENFPGGSFPDACVNKCESKRNSHLSFSSNMFHLKYELKVSSNMLHK